jgi:hypothetical protein
MVISSAFQVKMLLSSKDARTVSNIVSSSKKLIVLQEIAQGRRIAIGDDFSSNECELLQLMQREKHLPFESIEPIKEPGVITFYDLSRSGKTVDHFLGTKRPRKKGKRSPDRVNVKFETAMDQLSITKKPFSPDTLLNPEIVKKLVFLKK